MRNRLKSSQLVELEQLVSQEQTFWVPRLPLISDYRVDFILRHFHHDIGHRSRLEMVGMVEKGSAGVLRGKRRRDREPLQNWRGTS